MAGEKYRGKVGEHYVLYKLVREGFNAVLAPSNAEAVDIYASDPEGRLFAVQVKTKANAEAWRLGKKHEEIEDPRLFYALVDLGKNIKKEPPSVFILPNSEVARVCRVEHLAWLNTPTKIGKPKKSGSMRAISESYLYTATGLLRAAQMGGWRSTGTGGPRYGPSFEIRTKQGVLIMTTFATKTPLLKETLSRLKAFNDQLCYFTFVEEAFEQRLTEVPSSEQALYTPQVFSGNSRAHRIHVKVKELSDFRRATQSATFGAFASASYETVASYMKEALDLLRQTGMLLPPLVRGMH